MRLVALKQRLLDEGVFIRLAGAVQLAAAMPRRQFTAEAYLVSARMEVAENAIITGQSQRISETMGVVFWAGAPNDATGEAALDQIETKRDAIAQALLGWTPDDEHSPFIYAGGQLESYDTGVALWSDLWQTESYLRATA